MTEAPKTTTRQGRRAHRPSGADPAAGPGWPPRDLLVPYILLAVSFQRAHGYLIEESLRALGVFGLGLSTLYRTLRQLEEEGLLSSTWEPGAAGPARRVYTLTDAGRAWLDASAAALDAYRELIDRFFGLYGARPEGRSERASAAEPAEPAGGKES